jgi:hypothetical protein
MYLYASLLFLSACALSQQGQPSIVRVQFESITRGSHTTLVIDENSIQKTFNGTLTQHTISPKEWSVLTGTLAHTSLTDIPTFPSKANRHQSDGAMQSTLSIQVDQSSEWIQSQSFDDTKSPAELTNLMKEILRLEKKYFP